MKMWSKKTIKERFIEWKKAKRKVNIWLLVSFILACMAIALATCVWVFSKSFTGGDLYIRIAYILFGMIAVFAFTSLLVSFIIPENSRQERLRQCFYSNYVTKKYMARPVFTAMVDTINAQKALKGKKGSKETVVLIIHCAKLLGWISDFIPYDNACTFFDSKMVGSRSNYCEQKAKYEKGNQNAAIILSMKNRLEERMDAVEAFQKNKD